MVAMPGRIRCRMHGGTQRRGIVRGRNTAKATERRKVWLALLHALGLRHPGGRPRKLRQTQNLVREAKATMASAIAGLESVMPTGVMSKPIEELTAPEALGRASLSGLYQLVRLIEQPLDVRQKRDHQVLPHELKVQRLVGDMALAANKLFARVAEGELRGRQADALGRLLEEIAAARVVPPAK